MDTISSGEAFVRTVFTVLLGRPVDDASVERETAALDEGAKTRSELVGEIVSSAEFQEAAIAEGVLAGRERLPSDGRSRWPGTSERVVEIPWVVTRIPAARRLLDIGYAWASRAYLEGILRSGTQSFHATDLGARPLRAHRTLSDARALPYADGAFDVVTCVSTIEHVGRDNERYGVHAQIDPEGDRAALHEIRRVLAADGRALITVPVGAAEDHGWFVQYDTGVWDRIISACGFVTDEETTYALSPDGWVEAGRSQIAGLHYGVGGPGARAVLCAALLKSRRP